MGKSHSKPSPPPSPVPIRKPKTPPPSPDFKQAWRDMTWRDRDQTLEELRTFKPENQKVETVRILLNGAVGAGKSSLINSVNNIFQGRITNVALADNNAGGDSFTKTYKTYYIRNPRSPESKYAFAFNDVMGLEEGPKGVHELDLILALKGRVKDGYEFKPSSSLSEDDPLYNKNPSLEDHVHCLVTVVPMDKLSIMEQTVITKMRKLRLQASRIGIPQVVLLTKVDESCPLVKNDVRRVYKSKYIKQQMEKCSTLLGTPMNCIFPVKNYHDEIDLNKDTDELLLKALKHIVYIANDYLMSIDYS